MIYKRWITFRSEISSQNVNYLPIYYVFYYDKDHNSYIYLRCNIHPDGTQEVQLLNNKKIERFNYEKRENIVDYKIKIKTSEVFEKTLKALFTHSLFQQNNFLLIGIWEE